MRISLINESKKFLWGIDNKIIGEFAVPVQSIMTLSERPQFFNLLNEDGKFMGQILCNFFLEQYVKDVKAERAAKKLGETYIPPRHK